MIKLGEKQELKIVKRVEFGVYLAEEDQGPDTEDKILLPLKQVPPECEQFGKLEVFVYRDSKDRLIATTNMPMLTLHQTAVLTVSQVGKFGAFLQWGLEKDLLLPFKEQTHKVREGEKCLVALYIDKSNRLCATMKVYPYLKTDSPYKKDDKVQGTVYDTSDNFGTFVAIDNQYSGLIPRKELVKNLHPGETIEARVTAVREDGKLDLSIREKAYLQIETDADTLLKLIQSYDGVLPFNDKASPEIIKRDTQMSKNEFKRAVGHLLKKGIIEIGEKTIRLK